MGKGSIIRKPDAPTLPIVEGLLAQAVSIAGVTDETGRVIYANRSFDDVFGGLEPDVETLLRTVVDDDRATLLAALRDLREAGAEVECEVRVATPIGERDLAFRGRNLLDDPAIRGVLFTAADLTAQRRAQSTLADESDVLERLARARSLTPTLETLCEFVERRIEGSTCFFTVVGADGRVDDHTGPSLADDLLAEIVGSPTFGIGAILSPLPIVAPDIAASDLPIWLRMAFADHGVRASWTEPICSSEHGGVIGQLSVLFDVPRVLHPDEVAVLRRALALSSIGIERGRFVRQLEKQALHDELTGLPNRSLLLDRVEHALSGARDRGHQVAVLFIDVDDFKVVNDSLGHAAGDQLLRAIAARLAAGLTAGGHSIGRFGGDEFVVVCEDVPADDVVLDVAAQVTELFADPFPVGGNALRVRACIGVSISDGRADADQLIREADVAMYQAKALGPGETIVFRSEYHEAAVTRLGVEQALRLAVERGEIRAHFQPVFDEDRAIVSLEALARWSRDGEVVPADVFVQLAEEIGLIDQVDDQVLALACRLIVEFARRGRPVPTIAVNVSARRLQNRALVGHIAAILSEHDVDPKLVCLEITERAFVGDLAATVGVLRELADLGVQLAIDDFGTGYASMDYLLNFSFADILKVDQTFIRALEGPGPEGEAIVAASVMLGHNLDMVVVAEGVETERQHIVARELGVDRVQGYLLGRPMTAADLFSSLERGDTPV